MSGTVASTALLGGLGLALTLTMSAFGQTQQSAEPLDRIEFALAGVDYVLEVPRASRLDPVRRPGCVTVWHPRAIRTMTFLELCSGSATGLKRFAHHTDLGGGAQVRYDVDYDVGGGSGGTEGELKGELDFAGKTLIVTCHDQSEWRNDPEWCLPYLRRLTIRK